MTVELVIFDCDGVLVDTERSGNDVLAANLTRHGLSISGDQTHTLFAGGTMQSVGEEVLKKGIALPENWLDEVYQEIFAKFREGVEVIPGVFDLLDRLGDRKIAIASNGPMAKMEVTLKPSGLWDRFAGRIYSGHDHGPKPRPDMIKRIMADAGVPPEHTLMIDDMPTGCRAAQAAGIRCYGFVIEGDPARLDGTDAKVVT